MTVAQQTLNERIVATARKEKGTKEKPLGSNRGPRVCEYQSVDWIEDPDCGYYWCASFAWCWVPIHAGYKQTFRSPSVDSIRGYAQQHGLVIPTRLLEPGDFLCYGDRHINIFLERSGKDPAAVYCVGGNQSNAVTEAWYRIAADTLAVRLPDPEKHSAPSPPAKKPLFEIVKREDGKWLRVYTAPRPATLKKVDALLRRGETVKVGPVRRPKP